MSDNEELEVSYEEHLERLNNVIDRLEDESKSAINELERLLTIAYVSELRFTDSYLKETLEEVIFSDEIMAEAYFLLGGTIKNIYFAKPMNNLIRNCGLNFVLCQIRESKVKDLTTVIEHSWIVGRTTRDYDEDIEYEYMDEDND